MPELELSAGTIDYEDTGGSGPVIVFVHGLRWMARCGEGRRGAAL